MKLAVASGKGGTGKTTLSISIAKFLASRGIDVTIADCDVEEPNVSLFLDLKLLDVRDVFSLVPLVDEPACSGCGKCAEICQFAAIVMVRESPLVLPDMCHSCGGCVLVCPEKAISWNEKKIGVIESSETGNIFYVGGRLNIGEIQSPPLIRETKKSAGAGTLIIDSPPGTSCPVIESIDGADYVVLVTEPTPFGLHDLKLAVELVRKMGVDYGVVINRADIGTSMVAEYCTEEGIQILAEIPDSREIAEGYSRGEFADVFIDKFKKEILFILEKSGVTATGGDE